MGFQAGGEGRRRWVAVFALLLALSAGVSAIASRSPEAATAQDGAAVPSEEEPRLPDAQDVQEGLEAAERAEAERERWLQSPEAVRQRVESRHAFVDLTAEEAEQLLRTVFAEQLSALNGDPARRLSEASIVEQLTPSAAAVREGGERLLLSASIPLRAEDENGDSRKLDLELQATPGGFEPSNPLTELRIPDEADEPIAVGEEGLAVSSPAAPEGQEGEPLGEMNVFFPDALGESADADRLVSPTGTGVEIFDLLRSVESPETLRFALELPEGAELRPDGNGGAVVVRGEEQLASIPFPHAIDAQGTVIPVDLSVEGNAIVLHVAHRQADVAYPILVDPAIVNDWYNYSWANGQNLQVLTNGTWNASGNASWIQSATSCLVTCFYSSGRGLYLGVPGGNHPGGHFRQWYISAPNPNSYLAGAWINPFQRDDHNCSRQSYPQPHDYVGMWHNGQWNSTPMINQAAIYGYTDPNGWGSTLIIGMGTGGGANIPCRRDLAVGGTAIWEGDWQAPVLEGFSGIPSGWFGDQTQVNITAHARDDGLGVYEVTLFPEGSAIINHHVGCSGLVNSRCPTTYGYQKSFTANSLGEGIRTIQASAKDPLGNVSGTSEATTMVDRSEPQVTLSGQLAEATKEGGGSEQPPGQGDELSLPAYNLKIEANDGSLGSNLTKRSGVKDIEVWLDGKEREVPWSAQACPAPDYSCPMTQTYQLKLDTQTSAGKHVLEVIVKDQVGNQRKRSVEFEYIPATGIKDEYVMHYFPLPDGQGNEAEEEHPDRPELAVNVMNGNLVYREKDVEVPSAALDLEVERYYNSQLPEAENTEWGDGWTLAQTPDLEPIKTGGSQIANEAEILESSSAIEGGVELPTATGGEAFDPALQATLTKKSTGGYELSDETGEAATSVAFDAGGQAEALLTEGYAKVDFEYAAGKLTEIAVEDPATAAVTGGDQEEPEGPQDFEPPAYDAAFGSWGSGNGQFQLSRDAAVDTAGNVWAIDLYGERIQVFTPSGQFIRQVGGPGSGNGQFSYPSGIAAAPDGTVWVADAGNARIQQFNAQGQFVRAIGTEGSGNGQFSYPEGIAVGPDGKVWVLDTGNNRVQKLGPQGEYLDQFGSEGSEAGQLSYPGGIDVDPLGDVWVADTYNSRIQKFSPSGEALLQAGGEGNGDGQLQYPMGIAADPEGRVWVADTYNSRVEAFDSQGQHLGRFGSEGAGSGQVLAPMGIAADPEGDLWVADSENSRIQLWVASVLEPRTALQVGGFGSVGPEAGQLSQPRGVAAGPDGEVWVADTANDRIQHFDADSQLVGQFGTKGSGAGQLSSPRAVALDPAGNVWVADTSNHRIQKFDPDGDFLLQSGSQGTANGQFSSPMGIASDAQGNIWVADTANNRIQQLNAQGEFVRKFGSTGSGPGQLWSPTAVALDASGNVWVAEGPNHRVQQFTATGQFIRRFGSQGTGNGQFSAPYGIAVDQGGDIWVADTGNHRVQGFTSTGRYLTKFGSQGSASDQLYLPHGIAATPEGELLLADTANNRVRRWRVVSDASLAAPPPGEADPAVDVEVVGGLVAEVEGNAAGEHSYAHSGNDLVAHDGPDGETKYEYDTAGRMTKVTLPNGTWGSIAYFTDGRVKSVTVDPAGEPAAKTTHFEYSDQPRRTTVDPPASPHITYDIGEDGSVFRWWNTAEPPLVDIAGTLYDFKEKPGELWAGDHWLEVDAFDAEGIASIEVIVNGNVLVDEKHCEQDPEVPGVECEELENQWVAETAAHAPGRLDIEVLVTDSEGISAAERFWVDIPRSPPIAPGAPVPPKFKDVARFREEFGLEVVFPVKGETELNERIFNTIGAWHNPHTPAGAVARASWERWGVPLRAEDVAELDYRERALAHNGPVIVQRGENLSAATYAGYYMDHRAGGRIRVGFATSAQSSAVAALVAQGGLVASDRVTGFQAPPSRSLEQLRSLARDFRESVVSRPDIAALRTTSGIDIAANKVVIGATDPSTVASYLNARYGSTAAIDAVYNPDRPSLRTEAEPRERELDNRLFAGDFIEPGCTLAFGTWEKRPSEAGKEPLTVNYALTAGHCYDSDEMGLKVRRFGFKTLSNGDRHYGATAPLGRVARDADEHLHAGYITDAAAIRINDMTEVPHWIYWSEGSQSRINGEEDFKPGMTLCYSGSSAGPHCAPTLPMVFETQYENGVAPIWQIEIDVYGEGGDSGGPVWNPVTGGAVGLVAGGPPAKTWVTPLNSIEAQNKEIPAGGAPGALGAPAMTPRLKVVDCC